MKGYIGQPDRLGEAVSGEGKLHLYDVDDGSIELLPEAEDAISLVEKYFEPLAYLPTEEDRQFWEWVKSGWRE